MSLWVPLKDRGICETSGAAGPFRISASRLRLRSFSFFRSFFPPRRDGWGTSFQQKFQVPNMGVAVPQKDVEGLGWGFPLHKPYP